MKPFDPRLVRASRAVRGMLGLGVFWALLQATGIVLFAWAATQLVVSWFDGHSIDVAVTIAGLGAGATLRALAVWGSAATSARGAARAKAQLRAEGMRALESAGPAVLVGRTRADVTLLLGRGLDALDDYFGGYLPQLLLAVVSTPLLWLVIAASDPESGVTIALVIPLIPVFMVLIGLATRSVQTAQWQSLRALGRHFLDLVDGLSTLKIYRREHEQARGIRDTGDAYRRRTMRVLRLSFLSGFTLELAATLSVALVAVLIGTRLIDGQLTLAVGLFVLLLVPDVFAPLRQVGASFHAAADGLTAANELFTLIAAAEGCTPRRNPPANEPRPGVVLESFTVARAGRLAVGPLSIDFVPGKLHAIVGPSGAGKSSLLAGMLDFASSEGVCTVDGDPDVRSRIAWVPQHPRLSSGTIAENVALGDQRPDPDRIADCLRRAAAGDLNPAMVLGAGGAGLSGGQAQRVSIARALYRLEHAPNCRTLILDEPSSALDGDTQARLLSELRRLADTGVCVIAISHRDALVHAADTVLDLGVTP